MANFIDIIILCLYVVGLIVIAYISHKKTRSVNEFLLAGNGVSGIMSAFAYGTTYFSAVIFIGYAGSFGYSYGLGTMWIAIGNAFIGSLLAWKVLAKRTRRITHFYKTKTMPELLEARYQSKHVKIICAIVIFIFLVPYAASVYTGLGYLFELVFGLEFWVVVVALATLTAFYLFFGGYLATVLTDFFQGIIMLVGVIVMIAFVINYETVGGVIDGFSQLISDELGFLPVFADSSGVAVGYQLLMAVLLTSVGTWGLPQIIHKFHTVKSEKALRQASWVSTGFALIIGVCAYLTGCFARYIIGLDEASSLVSSGSSDMIIPNVLVEALPAGLLGLIVILVASASMSTLASLTLTSSSAIAVDFYKGYVKKDASDRRINILLKALCLVFIAVSVVIAIAKPSGIISLMSLSWGALAGCFLAPYIYGLYSKKATKVGTYASIFTALGVTLVLYILYNVLPSPYSSYIYPPAIGVFSMAASCIVMPIVSHFTTPPTQEHIEQTFTALLTEDVEEVGAENVQQPQEEE